MATTVHLVRHGHTDALGVCLAGRSAGWSLNREGQAAAGHLAAGLCDIAFTAVVASPLLRAQQTAAPIASQAALPVTMDGAFNEIDFGDWTGRSFTELNDDVTWHYWNRHRSLAQLPGGETMLAAQARAMAGLGGLCTSSPNATVLVVSHADIIKALLAGILGLPLDFMHRLVIDPASRSILRLSATTSEVLAVNLPPGA